MAKPKVCTPAIKTSIKKVHAKFLNYAMWVLFFVVFEDH